MNWNDKNEQYNHPFYQFVILVSSYINKERSHSQNPSYKIFIIFNLSFFFFFICSSNNREVSYEELKEKLKTAEKLLEQTENNVRQNPPGKNY